MKGRQQTGDKQSMDSPSFVVAVVSGFVTVGNLFLSLKINVAVANLGRDLEAKAAANDKELREWADEKFITKEIFAATRLPNKA